MNMEIKKDRVFTADVYQEGKLIRTIPECRVLVDTPQITELVTPDGRHIMLNGFSIMFIEVVREHVG